MYFIGVVIFIAFLVCTTLLSGSLALFIDFPSILIILAFSIPMLMASGLFADFIRAFKIMGKKINVWSRIELNRTEISLRLAIKLVLLSGSLGTIIGMIALLSNISDKAQIGRNLAVSILSIFYSILIIFLLLPLQAKVKSMIQTMDQE
ncbi:MotA/TolQ/ExbB proton channel family protein [Defluviitalea raffinosedens]|uniref:MotA/TolQ/ExbB proton channel family protein n=1 Tax=Defluviitalea raffinosedens TaxID=1450156 RepID=UPI00195AD13C|nr:MotA/TolQ/ExbB proton channel family protein [Defluviitalea raffinosedens]MBM7685988.1 flagellar motor component MotA [Defluviitalea raffinosedens]